jgi:hypothetical protein
MRQLWSAFELRKEALVLDIGGSDFNWKLLPALPRVILLNLSAPPVKDIRFCYVVGDGRNAPFKDRTVEILYCNSVIEHLGNIEDQRRFANECRRIGKRYYIQTPNRMFPIEPHLIAPIIHWLPKKIQIRLFRNCTLWGLITRPTTEQCSELLKEVRLLTKRELISLFPDGELWEERFLGMTKSLSAVKRVEME